MSICALMTLLSLLISYTYGCTFDINNEFTLHFPLIMQCAVHTCTGNAPKKQMYVSVVQ